MRSRGGWSRRMMLAALAAGAAGAVIGYQAVWPRREGMARRLLFPAYDRLYGVSVEHGTGVLPPEAMATVLALAELLYPPADPDQRQELHRIVRRWAAARTAEDGLLPLYVQASEQLDLRARETGDAASFPELPPDRQLALISRLGDPSRDRYHAMRPAGAWQRFRQREARHLLFTLREDLIAAIFTSLLGWKLVGNTDTWPGMPGDPAAAALPPDRSGRHG